MKQKFNHSEEGKMADFFHFKIEKEDYLNEDFIQKKCEQLSFEMEELFLEHTNELFEKIKFKTFKILPTYKFNACACTTEDLLSKTLENIFFFL